jgi:hypothetical protein
MIVRGILVTAHRMLHDAGMRGVRASPCRAQLRNSRHERDEQHRDEREEGDRTAGGSDVHGSMRSANGQGSAFSPRERRLQAGA